MKERIICWFSCGAASAMAAKLTVAEYGQTHDVRVVCCDTRASEHSDNYRFSKEAEGFIGQQIEYIRNEDFRSVEDVFKKTRYMAGVGGARCTVELKKKPRFKYAKPDDIHVFGLTADEGKRIREFTARNPELRLLWILQEKGVEKWMCLNELSRAGIKLPQMYLLGFDNNNCPGCVKATSPWYWSMIRKHFPKTFESRCKQSRELGVRLVEWGHKNRIFLDELPPGEFKKGKKIENLSCGPECGQSLLDIQ